MLRTLVLSIRCFTGLWRKNPSCSDEQLERTRRALVWLLRDHSFFSGNWFTDALACRAEKAETRARITYVALVAPLCLFCDTSESSKRLVAVFSLAIRGRLFCDPDGWPAPIDINIVPHEVIDGYDVWASRKERSERVNKAFAWRQANIPEPEGDSSSS